jgi:hypothetical protein
MRILGIDPGPKQSAWCIYDGKSVGECKIEENELFCDRLRHQFTNQFGELRSAIEMVESFGMPVGREVFETVFWCGRFFDAWLQPCARMPMRLIYRKEVKLHLCQSLRAKDANVRRALLDKFEPTGGGKTPQVGTKTQPGPLWGVKSHVWSALAVAVYWWDTHYQKTTHRLSG